MDQSDSKHAIFLSNVLKHQSRLFGYIYALIPNMAVVEDLVQETIMVMWEKYDTFEEGTNFFAWARTIARFKVINYLDKAHNSEVYFSEEVIASIEKHCDVFEKTDQRVEVLENCMQKLSDKDKELLKLKYVEDMTIKEVAEKKSRSIHGMYKVMARIHTTLEDCVRFNLIRAER